MKLIIDIPDNIYDAIKEAQSIISGQRSGKTLLQILVNSVENGTPLPKGHGRLIDADRLRSMYSINRANFNTVVGIQKWVDNAPTIIEADKADMRGEANV